MTNFECLAICQSSTSWYYTSYKWLIRLRLFENFLRGCQFAMLSKDLMALLLCPLHCNLTQVGLETCWFWSAKTNLPRHLTFKGVMSRAKVDAFFRVAFPIFKGRQLRIHCGDSEWSFSKKRRSVIRITMIRMAQIERNWNLITKA